MDLQLEDRVYLLTGATRGLGRASAEALVSDGARVVVSGRSEESVRATVDALDALRPDRARGVVADNADPGTPAALVAAAQEAWGRVDGVLVSVGGPPAGRITEMTDDQWTAAFGSVFLGAVRLAREVATVLGEGSAIAFVLSSSVRQPILDLAISNGLRPGLAMAAKTLADELGPRGIRVNGLLPGRIATERVAELDAAGGDPEAARAAASAQIPLRRYGRPEEFGRVAAFVLSPAASYLSGAMLPVDGGLLRAL
ncbi:SDR family oxidoreductase [Nocardioides sp. R1-1]|uniref:SDR family oxidoreductase n=1 Tax=Nocardioides sp. R1-1 TaxID=3383502 RepID=UPI0038D1B58D